MGVSIVLLAYREEDNLRILLPKINNIAKTLGEDFEVIVVDSAEPLDNTKAVCVENNVAYINQTHPGLGGALRDGIHSAVMDKILVMDADGSHDPKYIPDIHNKFIKDKADVCIGSRYVKGGVNDDTKISILMSKLLNLIFRVCLGFKARDISTNFRMYDAAQLKAVDLVLPNYDVLQEVFFKLYQNNPKLKMSETPIFFKKRGFGESKRKLMKFVVGYAKTLTYLTYLRFRNLILYGLIGLAGFTLDYSIFISALKTLNLSPEISHISGSTIGFLFTFFTNTFFNFKKESKLQFRFISYGAICLVGMIVSTTLINIFKHSMDIKLLKIIVMVGIALAQYMLNKRITYRS